jgi:hypothetical protein
MTAIAKVVSPAEMEQVLYKDWRKTILTMGMIDFGLEEKSERFFVRQRFLPFSKSRVSI